MVARYHIVSERDHDLQNPTSEEKLVLLGRGLGLARGARVLDVASGRGGPALVLAERFGWRIEGVEVAPEFHAAAVERAAERGLADAVSFELADASRAAFAEGAYDAALCLGASFVYGGLAETVEALAPSVRPGGYVVVGEPYWRSLPLPEDYGARDWPFTDLDGTVVAFESSGIPVVAMIASSEDDWDRYETLHWLSVETWLAENPDDPDAAEIAQQAEHWKRTYLRHGRDHLGWAIFVGWKRP